MSRDHAFDLVQWSHAGAFVGAVLCALWLLSPALASLACSASGSTPLAAGKPHAQGCTADVGVTGDLYFTEVLVVGMTPQGSGLWVKYPQRAPRMVAGKAYAELLPIGRFIPRGRVGHASNGRAARCPEALWGVAP